jgi:natural product biosynthesis luciferase-like monooxygenase protein
MDVSLFFFADSGLSGAGGYRLLLDSARFADANGLAAVWTPERHFHSFGGLYPNPAVTGAAVAAVTERVAVRAGSVVAPLHHPVRIAEEWSVVDNLSGGRAGVSFASGWHAADFVLRPDAYGERRAAMVETVETVRRLWRGEELDFLDGAGEKRAVRVHPAPVRPELPVWLTSAGSTGTFEAAGRTGAGVLTHLLGQDREQLAANIAAYRSALAQAHGPDAPGHVVLMLHTLLGRDPDRVRALARDPFAGYLRSSADLIMKTAATQLPPGVDLDRLPARDKQYLVERAVDRYFATAGLFGTVEDAVHAATDLRRTGVDEIACLIDFGVPEEAVLASLPELAELARAVA